MKHTLGLAMIMKDEVNDLRRILNNYASHFDAIYLTVTNENAHKAVVKAFGDNKKLHISYFAWCDHFGKARLFNQSQVKTDYWMWIDLDDEIVSAEQIPKIVRDMAQRNLDAILFQYDYIQNDQGESDWLQWRERIIKTTSPLKWEDVACHETVNAPGSVRCEYQEDIIIKHRKTRKQMTVTFFRNEKLLEKEWVTHPNARTAIYLGACRMVERLLNDALALFLFAAENADNADTKQRALGYVADNYCLLRRFQDALQATEQAIAVDPERPDAWYQQIPIYMALGQYDQAANAADIALSKKPDKYRISAQDPNKYGYKGQFSAAKAYLYNSDVTKAYELYQKVKTAAPQYIETQNTPSTDWDEIFEELAREPEQLDHMMPLPAKRWPKRSLVYYANLGVNIAPWGPDTLGDGMSGSEEAAVYLSRELAKLGWRVTVYCNRADTYKDRLGKGISPVTYEPITTWNPSDRFDVFIASRRPMNVHGVKARKKFLDLHDTTPNEHVAAVQSELDGYIVRSKWHRGFYPDMPNDMFTVIGNGILREHISATKPKRPHSAGYFSSYDRGLDNLLRLWPQIRTQVPDATLDIYYGWEIFDHINAKNPEMWKYKQRIVRRIESLSGQGVREHGRVSHERLARAMEEISVWLYPTEFTETFCITALKTAEAGMHQVVTDVGALRETAPNAKFIDSQDIYTDEAAQKKFVKAAIEALLHPRPSSPPQGRYWSDIAEQWDSLLKK